LKKPLVSRHCFERIPLSSTPIFVARVVNHGWTNGIEYEKLAVDDMMELAGVGEYEALGRPNVAYRIKTLRKANKARHGFDVYKVRQAQRTGEEPTWMYRVGGQEGVQIEVVPGGMGLPANSLASLTIPLAAIRETLEERGVVFEEEVTGDQD
jgi:hypothetical protein